MQGVLPMIEKRRWVAFGALLLATAASGDEPPISIEDQVRSLELDLLDKETQQKTPTTYLGVLFRDGFALQSADGSQRLRAGTMLQADMRYFPDNSAPGPRDA